MRFSDLDGMGHVNNAVFLTYLEQARLAWFRSYGEEESMPLTDVILAHTEVDFRLPLVFGETVSVGVRPSRLGRRSFELEYELRSGSASSPRPGASCVGYDYDAGQSTEVPERWRQKSRVRRHRPRPLLRPRPTDASSRAACEGFAAFSTTA